MEAIEGADEPLGTDGDTMVAKDLVELRRMLVAFRR